MAYIDTSVLVAYYCPEPLSSLIQKTLGRLRQPVISPLVEVEFCSALAAKVRARELDAVGGGRIIATFRKHLADGCYALVPIEAKEYALACDWISALSCPLRAADALHLAAAFANDLTLLTSDKDLGASARRLGIKCKSIE